MLPTNKVLGRREESELLMHTPMVPVFLILMSLACSRITVSHQSPPTDSSEHARRWMQLISKKHWHIPRIFVAGPQILLNSVIGLGMCPFTGEFQAVQSSLKCFF